jgi:hypothetical protein
MITKCNCEKTLGYLPNAEVIRLRTLQNTIDELIILYHDVCEVCNLTQNIPYPIKYRRVEE